MTVTINGTTGVTYPAGGTDNVAGSGVGTTDTQTLTNKTLTAAGSNTVEATSGPTSTQLAGMRNKIINGAMMIDQRNAGASISLGGSAAYAVDRFQMYGRVAGGATGQRSTTAPAGFINSLLFTVTSGATPAAGDYPCILQKIEGLNASDLNWGNSSATSVTLSFWVRSSVTGTYALNIQNSDSSRSYVAQYTVNAANTWEQKTITIPGDTTGTWLTTNGIGFTATWDLGFGFGQTTTANTWLSGDYRRLSSNVNLVATTGATFYITGVQLEKGATATPFENRLYGTELALCQRYYEQIGFGDANSRYPCVANQASGASQVTQMTIAFQVQKRAIPTLSKGTAVLSNCTDTADGASPQGCRYFITSSASGAYSSAYITSGITASAEL